MLSLEMSSHQTKQRCLMRRVQMLHYPVVIPLQIIYTAPEFLVLIFDGATNSKESDVDPRLSVKLTTGNKKHVDLKISSAAVSDSALDRKHISSLQKPFT
ncbi:hypothetical protein M9458_052547, partial [Cirrhinus mrigala]